MEGSGPSKVMAKVESLPYLNLRHAGYLGLASLGVFIVCWIIGAWMDEEWVLFDDSVCKLGVSDVLAVKIMYPIDCTISGIGLGIFGYSVARSCERKLQAIGYYFCIPFGIALAGLGIVNIDMNFDLHMVFVFAMAIFAGIVIGLTAIDDYRLGNRFTLPYFAIMLVVILLLFIFLPDYQQPITYVGMFIWVGYKCHHFITKETPY